MNESTFPGTERFSGQLPDHLPAPEPAQPITPAPSTSPTTPPPGDPVRPAPPARGLPGNYAEMPKPTAKLTAEDLAPVNDPNGPRNKIGPTGRPLPDLPEPKPPTKTGPAQVIAMCNQKGGVGKTTTTINLGAAIAETGRKVLLIDFDPQGSASIGLGVQPHDLDISVYNLLMQRDITPDEVIQPTRVPNLDLLPANIDLSAAEVQLVQEVAREYTLQRVLDPIVPNYDVILIDCAPSLGLLTVNALTASNGIVVPLECEFFALRGLAMLTDTIGKVQDRLNPKLEIVGILGTMFDGRTTHAREVLDRVVQAFDERVFHTVIRRTVKFPETTVVGEPITTYAPSSSAAHQYRDLAKEVLARCPAG
jgi:chromosome partitioning protein